MTTYTRAQLVNKAADKLLLTGNGQTEPEADDAAKIDEAIDPLMGQLTAEEIVDLPDLSAIPATYFIPLAELLANMCASEFGQQYSEQRRMTFEAQLRRANAAKPTLEVLKAEYF